MSGNIWEYLASFVFVYIVLEFCFWLSKMCETSPLLVFLFVKRSLIGFLAGVIIFFVIGYLVGWHFFGFSYVAGFICGFIYWIIIGLLLSERKKTVKMF